ncbi:hypothetical protein MHH37_06600 [Solibacillus sp. FSL K6-1781]|uniref:hypothetical protein n=1 Tax=Solibacillus sp. FSL K6-1781 TaxID=2921474 RepID=UPI003159E604
MLTFFLFLLGVGLLLYLIYSFLTVNAEPTPYTFNSKKHMQSITSDIYTFEKILKQGPYLYDIESSFFRSIDSAIKTQVITRSELLDIETKVRNFKFEYDQIYKARLKDSDKNELFKELASKIIRYFEGLISVLNNKVVNSSNVAVKDEIKRRIDKL